MIDSIWMKYISNMLKQNKCIKTLLLSFLKRLKLDFNKRILIFIKCITIKFYIKKFKFK